MQCIGSGQEIRPVPAWDANAGRLRLQMRGPHFLIRMGIAPPHSGRPIISRVQGMANGGACALAKCRKRANKNLKKERERPGGLRCE